MINNIKSISIILIAILFGFGSCKKETYSFGDLVTPSNLSLTAAIAGLDAGNPNGNGTGTVVINTTASNAITYKIDFGDGNSQMVSSGAITYKYTSPGTFDYVVTVNAVGTGGTTSTVSKKIKVYVAFEIPAEILTALTGSGSKVWVCDRNAVGHVGVGPADAFAPNWYAAVPNTRDACLYDDEITFTKAANNSVTMLLNNKGTSSLIGAATATYGLSGGDGCYDVGVGAAQKLTFMGATSASTTANSTRVQFVVPDKGIVNFATGGKAYEILSISATEMHLRNIGADGNSWYQKLKVK